METLFEYLERAEIRLGDIGVQLCKDNKFVEGHAAFAEEAAIHIAIKKLKGEDKC